MQNKKKGLPDFVKSRYNKHFVDEISNRTKTTIIRNISIEKIVPNLNQPRKDFGDLTELSNSIKEKGVIEPLIVRPKNGKFEIIAGERRFRASKIANLKEVPCIEHDVSDNEALELALIENIQRKNLNIFETAYSLKSLADIYGYTHQEIAEKIGKSRVTVSELLKLTEMPHKVVETCQEMQINSKSFLLELCKLQDEELMVELLKEYENNPFSREKIKDIRKGIEQKNIETTVEKKKIARGRNNNYFTFKVNNDKGLKLDFKIKNSNNRDLEQEELLEILNNLIEKIKNQGITKIKNN